MSESLHEIVTGLLARLRVERPSAAFKVAAEGRKRRTAGEAWADVLQWQLEEAASELGAADGSAFGAVAVEGEPAPPAGPVGGRPTLMSEDDRRAFLRWMSTAAGPVKMRVRSYLDANPWCRLSELQRSNIWRNKDSRIRATR